MGPLSRVARAILICAAGLAVLALGACSEYEGSLPKHMRPLDAKTRKLVERKGMELRSPILIRMFKEEATLEVWKQEKRSGRYVFLKDYDICAWSGVLGPKIKEGDRQAPEGFYTIRPAQMNPELQLLPRLQHGIPERVRSLARPHRLRVDGARRLLVARLLFHDRRKHPGDLHARPARLSGRAARFPGAGFSVPHDGGEHGPAQRRPEHAVLADAERGLRPLRPFGPAAQGRRLRASLHLQLDTRRGPELQRFSRVPANVDAGNDPHCGWRKAVAGQSAHARAGSAAKWKRRRCIAGRARHAKLGRAFDVRADFGRDCAGFA